jgi:hypothetical protein
MEILGSPILSKDGNGNLNSRIGTIFLKSGIIVTKGFVHREQRLSLVEELNSRRRAKGMPELTQREIQEEYSHSVDLVFNDELVLIRPDPDRMDLAFRADYELQKIVSKRFIRFLNTSNVKVRAALTKRGENWRMTRHPIHQDDIAELIERSKVSNEGKSIYYYNRNTGTRYITASGYEDIKDLSEDEYIAHIKEVVRGLNTRNRSGHLEVDLFPSTTPIEIRKALQNFVFEGKSFDAIKTEIESIDMEWRMSLDPLLREESVTNIEWRNSMFHAITRHRNESSAEEQCLISGIAPEFYRQIEWLPGARFDMGELIFDEIWQEYDRNGGNDVSALCDNRVKSLILNMRRLFSDIEYINVGRISHSLSLRPMDGSKRGNVYIIQYGQTNSKEVSILLLRFQKWGVAQRLDEGKDITQAYIETDDYTEYILDRRLMCLQLGMKLPKRIGFGRITERYRSDNRFNGMSVYNVYFVRPYIEGIASDKIPHAKYSNPVFACEFAKLIGSAAALDLVVGRMSTITGELLFDNNNEIVRLDANGMPSEVVITDHAGSFFDYTTSLSERVKLYAGVMRRRKGLVPDFDLFVSQYVSSIEKELRRLKLAYQARRNAFDALFSDRPFDTNGSSSYRWAQTLLRLSETNVDDVVKSLRDAIYE